MKKLTIAILSLITAASAMAQTKTVTNRDLERYRQQRLEAEKQLKERYKELGFPSPEERERQNEQSREEFEAYSAELRERRLESQTDILARADELRAEIASINAQINYLRANQNASPYKGGTLTLQPFAFSYSYGGYGAYGYGGFRGRGNRTLRQISRLPQNARTVQEYALNYPSSQSLSRQATGNVRIGGRIGGGYNYGKGGYYRGGYVSPFILGGTFDVDDVSSEITSLEQTRAGLLAEWRLLEEKARRAGIRLD
jgi:hypothetical protein